VRRRPTEDVVVGSWHESRSVQQGIPALPRYGMRSQPRVPACTKTTLAGCGNCKSDSIPFFSLRSTDGRRQFTVLSLRYHPRYDWIWCVNGRTAGSRAARARQRAPDSAPPAAVAPIRRDEGPWMGKNYYDTVGRVCYNQSVISLSHADQGFARSSLLHCCLSSSATTPHLSSLLYYYPQLKRSHLHSTPISHYIHNGN
jgi:hypothetical protein